MRVGKGGVITIPIGFRRELGLTKGTIVVFETENGYLTIQKQQEKLPKESECSDAKAH